MMIGSASIYLNNPVLVIGATSPIGGDLALAGAVSVASSEHVLIAARAQVGPVRGRLWSRVGPREGAIVFDGELALADGAIAISDAVGSSCFSTRTSSIGLHRVQVFVDDPGNASRVDVLLDAAAEMSDLTSIPNRPLPGLRGVGDSGLAMADELGMILAAHDLPTNRLAAAVKLLRSSPVSVENSRREAILAFRIRVVSEWLRWLRPEISLEVCNALGEFIKEQVSGRPEAGSDEIAEEAALEVIRRIDH
ncbi:hypothetical protein [Streptomyces sp. NPDC002746]